MSAMKKSEAIEKITAILDGLRNFPRGTPEERLHFDLAAALQSSRLDEAFAESMRTIKEAIEKLGELGGKP